MDTLRKIIQILSYISLVVVILVTLILVFSTDNGIGTYKDVKHEWRPLPEFYKTEKAKLISKKAARLWQKEKFEEAIEMYRYAITIENDNPWIYFNLADCYTSQDKFEEAIAVLDTAIILNDAISAFYINRGLCYYKLTNSYAAIQDYEKAIQLDTSYAAIGYINIAFAYESDNNNENACMAYKAAQEQGFNAKNMSSSARKRLEKSCD